MDTGHLKAWSSDPGSITLVINQFTTVLGTGDIKEDKTGSIASESINPVGATEVEMSVLQYKGAVRRHRGSCEHKRQKLCHWRRLCGGNPR